jgi:8-oxo-dGTP diphosphatase
MNYFRFVSGNLGIYEAVEHDCPRTDLRRQNKPDGSWLPRVGGQFPGAISFWTNFGLEKYLMSGLQEWHRSVLNQPLSLHLASKIEQPIYKDQYQVICRPSDVDLTFQSWEDFSGGNPDYPLAEKVVAFILRGKGLNTELLVFEHDKKWSEAGMQIPAGTVDRGESIELAAIREAEEESGLVDLRIVKKIDEYTLFRNTHKQFNRRHVYWMETNDTRDSWSHCVTGQGIDQGMNFHFYWMPLADAELRLAGSFGTSIRKIDDNAHS